MPVKNIAAELVDSLSSEAKIVGCKAVGGKGMLLEQGVAKYKLFVDREFPTEEFLKFNK